MVNIKIQILLIIVAGCLLLSGCQSPTTFETSISLLPVIIENEDPNTPAIEIEPPDPLDVLAAVEKIAARAGLKPYAADNDETSLLDIADTDLLDKSDARTLNITEWKHPDLGVYLTVTRKNEEILLLLNHTPDASGKASPDAIRLHEAIKKKLLKYLAKLETEN